MRPCAKCGSTHYTISADRRGVASAFCADCGMFIKKMSTVEVMEFYQAREAEAATAPIESIAPPTEKAEAPKPPCKYCTEVWGYRVGRVGQNWRPMEDIKYCPICGRELQPDDKKY